MGLPAVIKYESFVDSERRILVERELDNDESVTEEIVNNVRCIREDMINTHDILTDRVFIKVERGDIFNVPSIPVYMYIACIGEGRWMKFTSNCGRYTKSWHLSSGDMIFINKKTLLNSKITMHPESGNTKPSLVLHVITFQRPNRLKRTSITVDGQPYIIYVDTLSKFKRTDALFIPQRVSMLDFYETVVNEIRENMPE